MCIIVIKKKTSKTLPSHEIIKNCFNNNNDGAGIMYTNNNNQVIIEKGFLSLKKLKKRLNQLYQEYNNFNNKSLVLHFRIGTAGLNDGGNTHPFAITNNINLLRQTRLATDMAMAHNGIISDYNPDIDNEHISDTMIFIKEFIHPLKTLNKEFLTYKPILDMIEKTIGYSKLCFLDKNDNITTIGDYITDNGLMFSNSTYKPSYYNNWPTTTSKTIHNKPKTITIEPSNDRLLKEIEKRHDIRKFKINDDTDDDFDLYAYDIGNDDDDEIVYCDICGGTTYLSMCDIIDYHDGEPIIACYDCGDDLTGYDMR